MQGDFPINYGGIFLSTMLFFLFVSIQSLDKFACSRPIRTLLILIDSIVLGSLFDKQYTYHV